MCTELHLVKNRALGCRESFPEFRSSSALQYLQSVQNQIFTSQGRFMPSARRLFAASAVSSGRSAESDDGIEISEDPPLSASQKLQLSNGSSAHAQASLFRKKSPSATFSGCSILFSYMNANDLGTIAAALSFKS